MTANALRLLRKELGITQAIFGKILGIKRSHLAAIETGRLKIPESARSLLQWIGDNPDLFRLPKQSPEPQSHLVQKDLKRLRKVKENLVFELEKRLEKENQLSRTRILCEQLLQHYPNPTRQMELHLDSIAYDTGLALGQLQHLPSVGMVARIKGIEAEIETLEKGIEGGN